MRPRIGVADPADILRRAAGAIGRPLRDLDQLTGDASSLTYSAVTDAGDRVVVKVAPPGLAPVRNRDVLRQARVLTTLAGLADVFVPKAGLADVPEAGLADVSAPEVLGSDPGDPPDVPPLFVMSFADGESYAPGHVEVAERSPAADVRARAAAAARMLAALRTVGATELGIDENAVTLTAETVTLAAEVERWQHPLSTCGLAPEAECRRLLTATVPAPLEPAVLHGVHVHRRAGPSLPTPGSALPRPTLPHWQRTNRPSCSLGLHESPIRASRLRRFDAVVRYRQAAASALLGEERRGQVTERVERMQGGVPLLLITALTYL